MNPTELNWTQLLSEWNLLIRVSWVIVERVGLRGFILNQPKCIMFRFKVYGPRSPFERYRYWIHRCVLTNSIWFLEMVLRIGVRFIYSTGKEFNFTLITVLFGCVTSWCYIKFKLMTHKCFIRTLFFALSTFSVDFTQTVKNSKTEKRNILPPILVLHCHRRT